MRIRYSPSFTKNFRRLSTHDKLAVLDTIDFFQEYPLDPTLRNHPLKKPMQGNRSISVSDDLRIIFRERGGYIEVLMLDVGDHEIVYES